MEKKSGQATVEFLLLIAVMVPIIVAAISAINNQVFKKANSFLRSEIVAEVRYGYSKNSVLKDQFNSSNGAVTQGDAPLMYGPSSNTDTKHPIKKIKAGWV